MISSELPEILGMSDRIAVMHGGTIVGEFWTAHAATQEAILELALGHVAGSGSGLMIGRYRRELSVAAAYAVLLLVLAVAAPRFFAPDQLRAFVVSNAPVLVAAVGMTLVILCRQIDISIGSNFSICGVVAGLLAGRACRSPGRPRDARWPAAAWARSTACWSRGWGCRRSW